MPMTHASWGKFEWPWSVTVPISCSRRPKPTSCTSCSPSRPGSGSTQAPVSREINSWRQSLPALLTDLQDAGLSHVEVLLEHRLPYTPKRVDALLCGVDPTTRRPSYVLVELKQWTNAVSVDDDLVHVPHYGEQPVLHPGRAGPPVLPAARRLHPDAGDGDGGVHGLAYLHNAGAEGWRLSRYKIDEFGQLYTRDDRSEFIARLTALLDTDPETRPAARRAADDLLAARTEPSRQLLAHAFEEIRHREQFVLLDEQQVAFRMVQQAVEVAGDDNTKTVVVVLGGPGSGKSVVALSLLGELSRAGRRVLHATGSSSFTDTLRKIVVGSRSNRVQQMFVYFNSFIGERKDSLDVLICDEAHRLRETSRQPLHARPTAGGRQAADRGADRRRLHAGVPARRAPGGAPGRDGHQREIRAAAEAAGLPRPGRRAGGAVPVRRLRALRPVGSAAPGSDLAASGALVHAHDGSDDHYRVAALPSPEALESWLTSQNPGGGDTARIAAGYCWPWSDPKVVDGTKRSSTTSWSATGGGPGTPSPRSRCAVSRPPISGRATREASARSGASTPRRVSSTTGRA